ncbi:hypothetical protein Rmf_47690 [Roseomonas fluvialis]|uniref:Uncharacterized protein n=1 Tax=Roseomonas fluvialis TaxID=1750527 RepID=A0ABM7YA18_9PROT|nr:hypothetical protein Rmf_47690 [Roseomonas fluvialis]
MARVDIRRGMAGSGARDRRRMATVSGGAVWPRRGAGATARSPHLTLRPGALHLDMPPFWTLP